MGSINITDKAINKIQEVLKDQNMKYFRIRVKGGGCSGFQYVFKSENVINETKDHVFNFKKTISNNEKKYCMIMEKFAFAKENIPKNSNIKINQIK